MSTAARRLSDAIERLLTRRTALEAEAAKLLEAMPKAGKTDADADRRALADAAAKDLKDGGTREAELRAQFATRDNARATDLAMQQKAARQATENADRIGAELGDIEARLCALERELDDEMRRIAEERIAGMLPRYRAMLEEIAGTAMDLACLRAMAATRDADKAPWLIFEAPLFALEGFTAPAGFSIKAGMLTTENPRTMLDAAAKRYDALRAEITGNA